jgi:hypothetical protein
MRRSAPATEIDHRVPPSAEDRIRALQQPFFIPYSLAEAIDTRLTRLLEHPRLQRMPNLVIVGGTNNGKSMIVERFYRHHPPTDNPHGDTLLLPVLLIQSPPGPDEGRLYNKVLEGLFAPFGVTTHPDKKFRQIKTLLTALDTRLLVIDEFHHMLSGPVSKQRYYLNALKHLGTELRLPVVAVGTEQALAALSSDPQMANRFEPVLLPKWQLNEEFQRLLVTLERRLQLHHDSTLAEPTLAAKILALSEGTIGEVVALLRRAAEYAIRTGEERITAHTLNAIVWTLPSERNRQRA